MNHNIKSEQGDGPGLVDAWIDVGGTFTDCLLRIVGQRQVRGKTLSSGRVPLSLKVGSSGRLSAPELEADCDGFWEGACLIGYSDSGEKSFEREITGFSQGGRLWIHHQDDIHWNQLKRFEILPPCEAPVLAIRRLLQVPFGSSLPPLSVRMGTTRGTNALLTRGGAQTALLVTDPFADLLTIGDQTRPDLFALEIQQSPCLAEMTLTISERLASDGSILKPLDVEHARSQLKRARSAGCDSLAISLLHGYRNAENEERLEHIAQEFGFQHISLSSRVAPAIEYVARSQTTVVDAYLSPVVGEYLARVCQQLGGSQNANLTVMTSSGGLVDWRAFSGKDCILSGPAGGVIALKGLRQALDKAPMVGLDMGGTSTDVCQVDQEPELHYESTKAGVRILTPTLPIETVASGGGSVCWFDGVSLRVGPQSAGALPGPACYGRGGPLTITDLNVYSGRIPPGQFPFPLDLSAIETRIDELVNQIAGSLGRWDANRLVEAFRALAGQQMADAVRSVSIKQGIDPRDHVLVGFGGAAGQHICEIADALDVQLVLDHPDAGLLSAVGMGLARTRVDDSLAVYQRLEDIRWDQWLPKVSQKFAELTEKIRKQIPSEEPCAESVLAELRYWGTDAALVIPLDWKRGTSNGSGDSTKEYDSGWNSSELSRKFSDLHESRFGYRRNDEPVELVAIRLSIEAGQGNTLPKMQSVAEITQLSKRHFTAVNPEASSTAKTSAADTAGDAGVAAANQQVALPSQQFNCIFREKLKPGDRFDGPVSVLNSGSTLTVEENWQAEVLSDGSLLLSRKHKSSEAPSATVQPDRLPREKETSEQKLDFDPVFRDCYAQRLSAIATQMGYVLQQTAMSVNIKQRRDFSCAVFDAGGRLLANAPHVPVHLGAMGQTIQAVIEKFPRVRAGDCFVCNDPYEGGSHLPDLTVMVPVFQPQGNTPSLWVASRAHHADIGGLAPGSMSVNATKLEDEGVVIPPFRWTSAGEVRDSELLKLVQQSKYPPRNWAENQGDLRAQAAACHRGVQLLCEYAGQVGWQAVRTYGDHLLDAAEQRIRQFVRQEMQDLVGAETSKRLEFRDELEDGTSIEVRIEKSDDGSLRIDFTRTGPVSSTNFNANSSIVTAAVLYVLRCLVRDEMPLNAGVLRAVEIVLPESVLSPRANSVRGESPAVAAGNVETSQRVVDVLLAAFGAAAASQGTMNNLLFGTESFGFYETLGGGSGATAIADGASAVHSHMTNTRLTDPEVLEFRYPVRLLDFRIRSGSGGDGDRIGGDGMIRCYQFLEPVTVSLITSRRTTGPFGLKGGASGACGENWLRLPNGEETLLAASCQIELPAESLLTILTPGGGGYGRTKKSKNEVKKW